MRDDNYSSLALHEMQVAAVEPVGQDAGCEGGEIENVGHGKGDDVGMVSNGP